LPRHRMRLLQGLRHRRSRSGLGGELQHDVARHGPFTPFAEDHLSIIVAHGTGSPTESLARSATSELNCGGGPGATELAAGMMKPIRLVVEAGSRSTIVPTPLWGLPVR
jgi:hypothetical protein